MSKNVTSLHFDANSECDAEFLCLLNKAARIEHLPPHSLARQILMKHLTAMLKREPVIGTPEPLKAAV